MFTYLRNALVGFTLASIVAALAQPASAAIPGSYAGFVNGKTGAVSSSFPFTGVHTGKGGYKITAPSNLFHTFPVMTIAPFGINGAYVFPILDYEVCGNGTCTFGVNMVTLQGTLNDNGWVFEISQI